MPSVNEMLITAERMHDRLKLPRLVYTVDGMQVRFSDAPRQQDSPDVLVLYNLTYHSIINKQLYYYNSTASTPK